jgi:NRAMP (natural resistance-associated macrophage protein)-like metal ion transporter
LKKAFQITLGILTSIGGFLDVGAIATAVDAGARYHFQLIWAVILGTVCIIFLIEMVGRLAAVSHHSLAEAIRERFGFNYFVLPFCSEVASNFLLLGAEMGGVCLALQFLTGISLRYWALPVAFGIWIFLWKGTFGVMEKSTSLLGLVTLCFVVAAIRLHPPYRDAVSGFLPSMPRQSKAHYWFIAVAITSAILSSYLFYFYSSGAIEGNWSKRDIRLR